MAMRISQQLIKAELIDEAIFTIEEFFEEYGFMNLMGEVADLIQTNEQFERLWWLANNKLKNYPDKLYIIKLITNTNCSLTTELVNELSNCIQLDENASEDSILVWISILKHTNKIDTATIISQLKIFLETTLQDQVGTKFLATLHVLGPYLGKPALKKYSPYITMASASLFPGYKVKELLVPVALLLLREELQQEFNTVVKQLDLTSRKDFWAGIAGELPVVQLQQYMPEINDPADHNHCVDAIVGVQCLLQPVPGHDILRNISAIADIHVRQKAILKALLVLEAPAQELLILQLLDFIFRLSGEVIAATLKIIKPYMTAQCFTNPFDWESWTSDYNHILWVITVPSCPFRRQAINVVYEKICEDNWDIKKIPLYNDLSFFISQVPELKDTIIEDISGRTMKEPIRAGLLIALFPLVSLTEQQLLFDIVFSNRMDEATKYNFLRDQVGTLHEDLKRMLFGLFNCRSSTDIPTPQYRVNILALILPWFNQEQQKLIIENEFSLPWWKKNSFKGERVFASILFYRYHSDHIYFSFPNTMNYLIQETTAVYDSNLRMELLAKLLPLLNGDDRENVKRNITEYSRENDREGLYRELIRGHEEDFVFDLLQEKKNRIDRTGLRGSDFRTFENLIMQLLPLFSKKFLERLLASIDEPFEDTENVTTLVYRLVKDGNKKDAVQYLVNAELREKSIQSGSDYKYLKWIYPHLLPEITGPTFQYIQVTGSRFEALKFYEILFPLLPIELKVANIFPFIQLILKFKRNDLLRKAIESCGDNLPDNIREEIVIKVLQEAMDNERTHAWEALEIISPLISCLSRNDVLLPIVSRMEKALTWWP